MAQKTDPRLADYLKIVDSYDTEFKRWEERTRKILKIYRDDKRSRSDNEAACFNILWANVQTLVPAVYARMPKADVSRRFGDDDPVGRVGALLIERALDYQIEHFSDFRSAMRHSVEDRFLGGRGTSWVRYDPHISKQEVEITDKQEDEEGDDESKEEVDYECTPPDYVHWKDFGHGQARVWEEVNEVWRWVYLDKEAFTARFGAELAAKVQFNESPDALNRYTQKDAIKDKARVCELWDKDKEQAVWFLRNFPQMLDERDDPLELEGFFPCPRPLYATVTSDNLVPTPDYCLYQDQAKDLDILSDRIDGLVKALRVRGIYDASQPALQRLFTEGENNILIGTDKWAQFSEKGGLKGSVELMPLDMIAAALLQCYQAESNLKSTIYEITGISDIVRGESAASETATAQQIKGQYVNLRLKSMQDAVALYASEILKIMAQIMCAKFEDETILEFAAAKQMNAADQALIPQALELIRDKPLRNFRIEVSADSLVQMDEQQNKQDRLEFLNAFANFLREAVQAGQQVPQISPMLMEIMRYGVSGFKQARTIEGTIDTAIQQLNQKAMQLAANPQPTPEQMKIQAEQAQTQAKVQGDLAAEQAKGQYLMQIEQAKTQASTQIEAARIEAEGQLKAALMTAEQSFQKWEAQLKAATSIEVARIQAGTNSDGPAVQAQNAAADNIVKALGTGIAALAQHVSDTHQALTDMHQNAMQQISDTMKQAAGPKRILRGPDGRAIGVAPMETMQ